MMFFLSGRILERYGTTELGRVSGLLAVMPLTGGLFAAGMIALIGLPPFGLFLSKSVTTGEVLVDAQEKSFQRASIAESVVGGVVIRNK